MGILIIAVYLETLLTQEQEADMKKRVVKMISLLLSVLTVCCLCAGSALAGGAPETTAVGQPGAGNKVYFAAPLFSAAEREYNLKIVHILERYGYEVFLPQRDGFLAPELEGLTDAEKTEKIFRKDRDEVLKADIVFVLLDGRAPDEGACVELGMAYAYGKRCYGLKSDSRSVELDMDLNPMITGCLIKLFYELNEEKLINSLEEYLKNNKL